MRRTVDLDASIGRSASHASLRSSPCMARRARGVRRGTGAPAATARLLGECARGSRVVQARVMPYKSPHSSLRVDSSCERL
eukprot:363738-Chlamydomonas_euryale.AAC.2